MADKIVELRKGQILQIVVDRKTELVAYDWLVVLIRQERVMEEHLRQEAKGEGVLSRTNRLSALIRFTNDSIKAGRVDRTTRENELLSAFDAVPRTMQVKQARALGAVAKKHNMQKLLDRLAELESTT